MTSEQLKQSLENAVKLCFDIGYFEFKFDHMLHDYDDWRKIIAEYLKKWDLQLHLPEDEMEDLYFVFISQNFCRSTYFSKAVREELTLHWVTEEMEILIKRLNQHFFAITDTKKKANMSEKERVLAEKLKRYIKVYKRLLSFRNFGRFFYYKKTKMDAAWKYFFLFPFLMKMHQYEWDLIKKTEKDFAPVSYGKMFHRAFYTLYTPTPIYDFFKYEKVQDLGSRVFIYKAFDQCNFVKKGIMDIFPNAEKFYFFKRTYNISKILCKKEGELFDALKNKQVSNNPVSRDKNFNMYCMDVKHGF